MPWLDEGKRNMGVSSNGHYSHRNEIGRARLVTELFGVRYRERETVQLRDIAEEFKLDHQSVLRAFAEFQTLGMVTLTGNFSATFHSRSPKDMREAYEIRAALEEIAGRSAAAVLKRNTVQLQSELDAMRAGVRDDDLDRYADHDVKFHKIILKAAQNEVLMRVWDTLTIDLRMRATNPRILQDLPDVVESHQPIVDALEKGRGREAGVLLRSHVETFLEYLRRADSESGENRAIRRDLEDAKQVQQAFFPPASLSIPCLSCETFYQPARGIGGDYYDLLQLEEGRWGIAIGDVSGKGIGAALIMASLQASLRAQTLHPNLDLSTLMGDVNRLVYESSPPDFFATLFYAEYKPATRTLNYVNAGHDAPLVVRPRNGRCEIFRLDAASMPVGISATPSFASAAFRFQVDDVLVAYTDGITEAQDRDGEHWGRQRLEKLLLSYCHETPQQIIDHILNEISTFANGQPQQDDATLVVMGIQEGCDV